MNILFYDRQGCCGIHPTFRWGDRGIGPRRIRFTVVLYLLDGVVFYDILKKPVIAGIQRSNKSCRAVKGLVI